jgi:hypothetical protein
MNRFFKQLWLGGLAALGILCVTLSGCATPSNDAVKNDAAKNGAVKNAQVHPWEMQEIVLHAEKKYTNYYTDVDMWVQLKGPDFDKKVYGFWDGDNRYVVRLVATQPGEWSWRSASNHPDDAGLNDHTGAFTAIAWSAAQKKQNPNRQGFVQVTPNGHALQYADGTPFFMVGDTWLAGSTWRLPFRNAATYSDYQPGPGIGFEDAVAFRKKQGFNSVSMIAAFPNWDADSNPSTFANKDGLYLRNAWEKFGYQVAGEQGTDASGGVSYWGSFTAKNMRDEVGNLPFALSTEHQGVSDFTRINPAYFQSLDKKMAYMAEQGFVPLLETVRRDVGPSWNAYYDFNETFSRYVQYLISRYGAWNFVFSGIHLDWIPEDFSLTAAQFNEALTYHLNKYGPLPFGQPHTTLIDRSTHMAFGHGEQVPWLTMHSVGNKPRDHRVSENLEAQFRLEPPYPTINFEPYYTGWLHEINKPAGEEPPANSARDNYFARAQMYGSVLSGGLSGHVHGTAAYDVTSTGEPEGSRPHIWQALNYESANYMGHLETFIQSEGKRYQDLQLASEDISPRKAPGSPEDGLDGWSYMMRTADKTLAMLYFENASVAPRLTGFVPAASYTLTWFDPINGQWQKPMSVVADSEGAITVGAFPQGEQTSSRDWAAKITRKGK